MNSTLKYKLGTTIEIDKQKVLDYFEVYIDYKNEKEGQDMYVCKDGSLLILQRCLKDDKVFVKFHCNLQMNSENKAVSFIGKSIFLAFCQKMDSQLQNLNTKNVMPASDGAVMSDLFASEAYRLAKHYADHPKDEK